MAAAAQFYVARFNDELAGGPANPGIAPIGAEELQTALDTAHAANYEYHASTEEQDQLNDLRNLRFGNEGARTVAERHAFEWSERLSDFLKKFEAWDGSGVPDDEFFFEKCTAYTALIELAPPGPDLSRVIQSYVGFLGENHFQIENRIEWFSMADFLFKRLSRADGKAEALAALRNSRDSTLSLYARVERALPGTVVPVPKE